MLRAICSLYSDVAAKEQLETERNASSEETEAQQPSETSSATTRVNMHSEQRQDQFCRKYIDILESKTLTEAEKERHASNFSLQDGLLHRIINAERLVLVVPARRRDAVLISCHDVPLAGHLGFSRTLDLARNRFFWPKMRRDIKRHVASCSACQKAEQEAPNTKRQGLT